MVKERFVPNRGDIVWINLDQTKGREQSGSRPAVVISPQLYNDRVGMMLACPITSKIKGYPFEVPIHLKEIRGVILVDHIRSIDWTRRSITLIGRCDQEAFEEVQYKLRVLIND